MDKQHDWKKLLKADPTNWLLEPDDPGVRYFALRDIVITWTSRGSSQTL